MIIYHLFDAFTKYMNEVLEAKRLAAAPLAVWPCRLKIIKAFAHRDPIILGCDLIEGTMKVGAPVGVVKVVDGKREIIKLGKMYVTHAIYAATLAVVGRWWREDKCSKY